MDAARTPQERRKIGRRPTPHHSNDDALTVTLPGGARFVAQPLPGLHSTAVSVFVRTGSLHETRATSGISHFVEHMVFKGTATRDARRINRDAEGLGAEVNAHTDKDHTAFHLRGLPGDAPRFIEMLGDLVLSPVFPADELERERQVLVQELAEDEDDPMSVAFRLFDSACWGTQAAAMPVLGSRRQVERFSRDDLAGYHRQQYRAANLVITAAGAVDAEALARHTERVFAQARPGAPNLATAPSWRGGVKTRALSGSSQAHLVMGWPIAGLRQDDPAPGLAAALFGEGMSSPLMEELREKRGLAYYAACSADVFEPFGQFVVEASLAPEHLLEAVRLVRRLMQAHAERIDPAEFERARRQVLVRRLCDLERPGRANEDAALELFALDRLRPPAQWTQRLQALGPDPVRLVFERMLAQPAALAVAGSLPRGAGDALRAVLAGDAG